MCNDSWHSTNHVDDNTIHLRPVGVIKSQFRHFNWVSGEDSEEWWEKTACMKQQQQAVSEIVVDESLEGILDGIEEFSHLIVLFWGHQMPDDKRFITRVHPLGNPEFPLVGVFATHSPVRPNSILVTVVKLLERNGNVLEVSGLDAVDGSPLLDIKPYITYYEELKDLQMPDWMRQIQSYFGQKECTDAAD